MTEPEAEPEEYTSTDRAVFHTRDWLQAVADEQFKAWLLTKDGKRWKRAQPSPLNSRQSSPYYFGFSLPEWHQETIHALNRGDLETALHLKMTHGPAGYGHGKKKAT